MTFQDKICGFISTITLATGAFSIATCLNVSSLDIFLAEHAEIHKINQFIPYHRINNYLKITSEVFFIVCVAKDTFFLSKGVTKIHFHNHF